MENNDIAIRPSQCQVFIGNDSVYNTSFQTLRRETCCTQNTHCSRSFRVHNSCAVNSWRSNCHQRWHTLILHLLWNRTHVAVNRGPIYGLLCLFFKALQGNYAYQISLMLHDTSNAMNTSAKSEQHIYKQKLRRQALIHQSN